MLESSPCGLSRVFLRLLYLLCATKFVTGVSVTDAAIRISTPNVSPFKKFLSDRRFGFCPTYEESDCEVADNDTGIIESPKSGDSKTEEATSVSLGTMGSAGVESEEGRVVPAAEEADSVDPREQPPIATFDEWTKEKLKREEIRKAEQHQNQHQNIIHADVGKTMETDSNATPASKVSGDAASLSPPVIIPQEAAARNYASKECGAKVLFSNDEAENKNGVLNEKEADDYMRNPCERAEHKWLIIELCETVQPTALEIANFELFSSGPQRIRLFGSERYPSNEWIALGEFVAENSREIQRFPIVARSYVKFIRLELLTHYGREHYCTLSLVRLLGISMVDEYEAEAEAAAAVSGAPFSIPTEAPSVDFNNTATNELNDDSAADIDATKESVAEITEAGKKNESVSEIPLVNAVVNAVGSIRIGNIKGILESTFLGKSTAENASVNTTRSFSTVEICRNCFADFCSSYLLFCRAFFGPPSEYDSDDANRTATWSDRQISRLHQSIKKPNQKERNASLVLELFLTSVLSVRMCKMEEANLVKDSFSRSEVKSNENSETPPNIHPPAATGFLNAKLGPGFMLPGGVMSHKESIFFKLNKRISSLELNMSLSSEYLSELSRRYVLQTNENRRQGELIIKQAEEAAISAVRPIVDALKVQVDSLAASLKELTETLKDLREHSSPIQRTAMLKHVRGGIGGITDSSLARSQANFYSYRGLWTTTELVCIIALVNILTLLILFMLHCTFSVINRGAVEKVVDERLEKFIQRNTDVRRDGEVRERNSESASSELRPDQQTVIPALSTVSSDVAEVTPTESVCSFSSGPPGGGCSLTENETPEEMLSRVLQSIELDDRPSRLSTGSDQSLRQARRRKRKKRTKDSGSESSEMPRGFGILSNIETI